MNLSSIQHTPPENEPVLGYAPGTPERSALKEEIQRRRSIEFDIPMHIGGKDISTGERVCIHPPHDIAHTLGYYHKGGGEHVQQAIQAALDARESWQHTPADERATIFLKAADLFAGKYRYAINATTMLGQSKNVFQAEIDAACELIDFLRFNVHYMYHIYRQQPVSAPGMRNSLDYRPLEGFVFAVTPFNFTAIAGNLAIVPAMLGNVVVWKPAETQIYSARLIMDVLLEAGLPPGVINLIYTEGPLAGQIALQHPELAGINFTGSTAVFRHFWKEVGSRIDQYRSYPRLVGETGGKDFVVAHYSADTEVVATALVRGAFEFQGQKCSAASRAYIPHSLWPEVWKAMQRMLDEITVGPPEEFHHFVNAVIDEKSFYKISTYIEKARELPCNQVIAGGTYDKSSGYFIQPTVILTTDPHSLTMEEEIFGPVLTIYCYYDDRFEETLQLVDNTSPYGLTGAIIAEDRQAVDRAAKVLRHAAGNFYINDKPTGAVVGQQPFGGSRASGTNDKAGFYLNLLRWITPRTIKENLEPPKNYRYPFLDKE